MKTRQIALSFLFLSLVLLLALQPAAVPPTAAKQDTAPISSESRGIPPFLVDATSNRLSTQETNGRLGLDAAVTFGTTTRVSVASDGTQGNSGSYEPSISANGRYVAFDSNSNLVSGDANGEMDVFVHDRQTGQTTRVSVASDGTQGNGRSGRFGSSISADGRYVAFISEASNLVSGDTNGYSDVFVHDRQTGQTTRVSVASDGTQGTSSLAVHLGRRALCGVCVLGQQPGEWRHQRQQ